MRLKKNNETDKVNAFVEESLRTNGFYCLREIIMEDHLYDQGYAFPVWTKRAVAEQSEESKTTDMEHELSIYGMNIYEYTFGFLPKNLSDSDDCHTVKLYSQTHPEGVFVKTSEFRKILLKKIKEADSNGQRDIDFFNDEDFRENKLLHKSEINDIIGRAAGRRKQYFLKTVKRYKKIWVLVDEEFNLASYTDGNGLKLILAWPEREYAEMNAKGIFSNYIARWINPFELVFRYILKERRVKQLYHGLMVFPIIKAEGSLDGYVISGSEKIKDMIWTIISFSDDISW